MKRIYIALIAVFIIGAGVFIWNITDDSARADEPLHIMYISGSDLGGYVHAYKFANRDMEINTSYYDFYEYRSMDKYNEDLTAMLMAGNPPDVFEVTGELMFNFAGSAYFEDFYSMMERDRDFDRSLYFENVLEAFERDGKLSVFPLTFYLPYMGINKSFAGKTKPGLEDLDYIDVETMIEMFQSVDPKDRESYYCEGNITPSTSLYHTSYLDLKNNTVDFTCDEFVKLLEDSRTLSSTKDGSILGTYMLYNRRDFDDMAFAMFIDILPFAFLPYKMPYKDFDHTPNPSHEMRSRPTDDFVHLTPFATGDGRQLVQSGLPVAIYSGSVKKDVAWDFIKFCTAPEQNSRVDTYLMYSNKIRKDVTQKLLKDTFMAYCESFNKNVVTDEMIADIDATVSFLTDNMETPKFQWQGHSVSGMEQVLRDFLVNGASAYDTAGDLQRMVETYYIEKE